MTTATAQINSSASFWLSSLCFAELHVWSARWSDLLCWGVRFTLWHWSSGADFAHQATALIQVAILVSLLWVNVAESSQQDYVSLHLLFVLIVSCGQLRSSVSEVHAWPVLACDQWILTWLSFRRLWIRTRLLNELPYAILRVDWVLGQAESVATLLCIWHVEQVVRALIRFWCTAADLCFLQLILGATAENMVSEVDVAFTCSSTSSTWTLAKQTYESAVAAPSQSGRPQHAVYRGPMMLRTWPKKKPKTSWWTQPRPACQKPWKDISLQFQGGC